MYTRNWKVHPFEALKNYISAETLPIRRIWNLLNFRIYNRAIHLLVTYT